MTPLAGLIRDEILRAGPIPFDRFMRLALYHPEHGYYRRPRDPFGKAGDFYTAEQLQPVFGILIAARLRQLGVSGGETVVELGAGRGEMAEALAAPWHYAPVDVGRGALPESFTGAVFANEFFDALPVEVAVVRGGAYREMRVGVEGERFHWVEAGPAAPELAGYLGRYTALEEDGALVEANREALAWIERIASRLAPGFLFVIDYGYTRRESIRFPRGTLMAYRRHQALEDVLADPGGRDITAQVNFTALEEHALACGFERLRFESLARTLLDAGEPDQFSSALAGGDPHRRLQLKTLLFGMGESFRTLILRKGA